MEINKIKNMISNFPDTPGVYYFCGKDKKILYIGKATSLRDRVRSYFNPDILKTRSGLVSKMLTKFKTIEVCPTDSVLEALVLEAHLIKKHQPSANIQEKDNKSFNFVVITEEDFPQVLVLRGRELLATWHTNMPMVRIKRIATNEKQYKIAYSFGPFTNGSQLKEALKIIRRMFPYRDNKCIPFSELKPGKIPRPCFNRMIWLCPGVCTGEITKEQYAETVKNIIFFFEGNKKKLIKNLENQMKEYAKHREFEKANGIKRTIFTLKHIQDISLIKEDIKMGNKDDLELFRIESYDIAHMGGMNVVGVMTVIEDGETKKSDYRKFKIRSAEESFSQVLEKNLETQKTSSKGESTRFINDTKALSQVLERRLGHIEWRLPNLIVVDGGLAQKRVIEKVLSQNHLRIPVVSVVKDEHHKAREILGDKKWLQYEKEIILSNSEAHRFAIGFHKKLRNRILT